MNKLKCLNSTHLKLIAMVCMFVDHAWGLLASGQMWMTCVGRIAFPIFAFQIAEGYAHTKHFKRYLLRLFLFALISEIPYNFMSGGGWFNPLGQNVMFTFCLSLLIIRLIDRARAKHWAVGLAASLAGLVLGYLLGMFTFVDYHGYGVLMVLAFWMFREVPYGSILQLASMVYINCFMVKGLSLVVGETFVPIQCFAVLAMIPILLYNGKQGPGGKPFRMACYAFYPVHIAILVIIAFL